MRMGYTVRKIHILKYLIIHWTIFGIIVLYHFWNLRYGAKILIFTIIFSHHRQEVVGFAWSERRWNIIKNNNKVFRDWDIRLMGLNQQVLSTCELSVPGTGTWYVWSHCGSKYALKTSQHNSFESQTPPTAHLRPLHRWTQCSWLGN